MMEICSKRTPCERGSAALLTQIPSLFFKSKFPFLGNKSKRCPWKKMAEGKVRLYYRKTPTLV